MPKDYRKEVEWCKFASERIMGVREALGVESHSDSLRYFIVGNWNAGFLGIERDGTAPRFWNEEGMLCWPFKPLDEENCGKVLRKRLYEFSRKHCYML